MRRLWLAFGVIAAACALVALLLSTVLYRPVMSAVLAHVAKDIVTRDVFADVPDGLHVGFCGSHSPMPDATRAATCNFVLAGETLFIFDIGAGSAEVLALLRVPVERVEALYLTHFHADHYSDLGELTRFRWLNDPSAPPLLVRAPGEEVHQIVDGFNLAYAPNAHIDNDTFAGVYDAVHAETRGPRLEGNVRAVADVFPFTDEWGAATTLFDQDGIQIQSFTVDHGPAHPAVGFRVDYGGRSVVFSGDTVAWPTTIAAVMDVDLLVFEAFQTGLTEIIAASAREVGRQDIALSFEAAALQHVTPEEVAKIATQHRAQDLIYYHLAPPPPNRLLHRFFIGDAHDHFDGPISLAKEGLVVSLPSGSDAITYTQHAF